MIRNRNANFGNAVEIARSAGSKSNGLGGALVSTGKKKAYRAANAAKQLGTMAGKVAGSKGGKAGMALAGLAAAGGLGVAGMKALKERKKKANSLGGKVQGAIGGAKKKLKGMGLGN